MTESELPAFLELFGMMSRVFFSPGDEQTQRIKGTAYFKALSGCRLKDIQAGSDAWMRSGKRFPKPAEWMDAIPRRSPSMDYPPMTDAEARAYLRAEQLCWEDLPCACAECVRAGISDKPVRFVPEFTPDDQDHRVRDVSRDRVVTAGHWAHGHELAGYYRGKNAFWNKMLERFGANGPENRSATRKRLERAMANVGQETDSTPVVQSDESA